MPIRSHRLALVCTLALLLLSVAPVATAQVWQTTLSASPQTAEAEPGGTALFDVALRNDDLVARSVSFHVTNLSPGWGYNFSQLSVTVPAGGEARTNLTIFVDANATAGDAAEVFVRAYQDGTEVDAADPLAIGVTVVAASEPTPEPTASGVSRPDLALDASDASAAPGERASATLTIHNGAGRDVNVRVALTDTYGWSARVHGTDFYVLQPGATRVVELLADVPATAQEGLARTFTVVLDADGHEFSTPWTVTVAAAPAKEGGDADATSATDGGSGTDGDGTADGSGATGTAETQPETLALTLHKLLLEVEPGATGRASLTLSNPTLQSALVHLAAEAPEGWTVAFEADAVPLRPGESRELWFSVTAPVDAIPGGIGQGVVVATADGLPEQRAAFSVSPVESTLPLNARDDSDADASTAAGAIVADDGRGTLSPVAVGLGAVGVAAAAISRRSWRERLMWGGIGLYTRLLRPDILRHEEREKLHVLIGEQPGIHFHALQRELSWNTGTLTYHLRVLERHNFVVSRRDGQLRRFYHTGAAPRKETFAGPSGLRADVLEAVQNQPGLSQSDLTLALGANKQTVNYHVKALERQGLLRIEKRGRDTFLYVVGEVPTTRSESASA